MRGVASVYADQPVPNVTDDDVTRIAVRDFGESNLALVMSILKDFGEQEWNQPSPRVSLAMLKLADGDFIRLREATRVAIDDYRDVLSAAEYPGCMNDHDRYYLQSTILESVVDDDWKQYQEWLTKK